MEGLGDSFSYCTAAEYILTVCIECIQRTSDAIGIQGSVFSASIINLHPEIDYGLSVDKATTLSQSLNVVQHKTTNW